MSPLTARMGWNPDSPTNELRISLLAYLRARLHRLEPTNTTVERDDLRRWIAWLAGDEVST